MERDLKNVYDLTVSQNLEESERRFAAKLEDMVQPCAVDEFGGNPADGGDFTGTFLETGVSWKTRLLHCFELYSYRGTFFFFFFDIHSLSRWCWRFSRALTPEKLKKIQYNTNIQPQLGWRCPLDPVL